MGGHDGASWRILVGDVREQLRTLPDASVQCCVTSPPYWGLRDYGMSGQIGLEPTPDAYVATMVEVFAEVWRVLRDDGTLWLNLGDSYAASQSNNGGYSDKSTLSGFSNPNTKGRKANESGQAVKLTHGLKPKDLVGIPWRVAFALQAAGWYLRSDIIWAKPNPMPESVKDRPTKAHEYIFLLTKRERYYYDAAAVSEMADPVNHRPSAGIRRTPPGVQPHGGPASGQRDYVTRNKRSVWTIPTTPYSGAHFATMPEALVEPCVLAGSRPGDLVLDPFAGSGTTGAVAVKLGRRFVGCELNPGYVELARNRIGSAAPLFAREAVV